MPKPKPDAFLPLKSNWFHILVCLVEGGGAVWIVSAAAFLLRMDMLLLVIAAAAFVIYFSIYYVRDIVL